MSGTHESARMGKDEWLTPPWLLNRLGAFDLDPCAPSDGRRPWDTAARHYSIEQNGLNQPWSGRVWLNPPYGKHTQFWMKRLAAHGNGIALIFARTDTEAFFEQVWDRADGVLFLRKRLVFHHVDGRMASCSAGAASVLVAYEITNVTVHGVLFRPRSIHSSPGGCMSGTTPPTKDNQSGLIVSENNHGS